MSGALESLNALAAEAAATAFRRCCGSTTWVDAMVARRPYANPDRLHRAADAVFDRLEREDWLEAFASHPRIGESRTRDASEGNRQGPSEHRASDWSAQEQAGVRAAEDAVRASLAADNDEYYERFGYIFLTCATGKAAAEMLAELRRRLRHQPDDELPIAVDQQRLITHLRLDKLLEA